QYLPGMAGGANNANGPDADSLVNPLDFIMMLEGTIAFRSSASRRFESLESSRAATPFAVNACGAAYPSASTDDEGARGEQWMPLWSRPSTYKELRYLLAEGRAQISSKAVREPLDLARAVKRLGTARGIRSFQRYGYIERNGQSNLAVPLGRFDVANQDSDYMACIDDLDLWLRHLRKEARDKNAPARLRQVEKSLVDALFTVTAGHSQDPDCWQGVLSQLAEIEAIMRQGTGHEAQPVPLLRPKWVVASNDKTREFRLALAFALQGGGCEKSGIPGDPIRRHWLPLDQKQRRFATSGNGLDMQPEVVMHGRRGLDDAIALVQRRLVEASQHGGRHLPLNAARQASASIADLTALLTGGVDLDRTLVLARAFMALDHKAWAAWSKKHTMEQPHDSEWPDDPWLAIRLCTLPWPLRMKSGFELDIGADPALVRRLATGDATTAFVIASRRLRAAGVRCTIRSGAAPPETARLWAAALAFPITETTAKRFLSHLDPSKERPCPLI
ncbi:MAG: type I-U CRISPR-associated protein Csx17, partial [Synechococcus sp. SB0670_bin_20]|nr:type I-U CRISPR-associated protein Csx17 [Synechococcus sp. SB0670_bin_20]